MADLNSKIENAIHQQFVGDTRFSEEELAELFDKTGELLRQYTCGCGNTISHQHDEMMFVAMVNAVKLWETSEETFWSCISRRLMGSEGSQKTYRYLTEVIERLGKANRILYLDGCAKRYYATVLAHSFAPQQSTNSFLELCWQLYTKDLNFNYYGGDELFCLISNELKKRFSSEKSEEDDFKLGSEVYSLRAGIKRLAIEMPDKMGNFIDWTVSLIDKSFNGELLESESHYECAVKKWWELKSNTFGQNRPKRKSGEARAITDYSHIRPKYIFNGRNAVLIIPSIRLKEYFYENPHAIVFQNGECVDDQELLTFGSGLSMATNEKELYVDNLLSTNHTLDYELKIFHGDSEIYSSGHSLNRQFILFKDQREILQDECLPGNYMIYTPDLDSLSAFPAIIKKKDYNLYVFAAENGEYISGLHRTVLFANEKQKRNIRIVADRKNNVRFLHDGEDYKVIDGDLKVCVAPDIDVCHYGVRYEDVDFRLCDFDYEEHDGEKSFLITQLLNVGEPQKISVFSYSTNQIEATFNVVKFNSINIEFDKSIYFDNNSTGVVRFRTEKYDKSATFDIKNGDIDIPFSYGTSNDDIIITPPILRWKIADMEYQIGFRDDLWYRDFLNSAELYVDVPGVMNYQVIQSNNALLSESSCNSYRIGEILYSGAFNCGCLTIFVQIDGVGIFPIFRIQLKETFRHTPFIIIGNTLFWDPERAFVGDKGAQFRISVTDGDRKIFCRAATLESQKMYLGELDVGQYSISVDIVKQRAFTQIETVRLIETKFTYGDLNTIRFKGKRACIHKLMLTDEALPREIKPFWIDHIHYIKDDGGIPFYYGCIYIIDNKDGRKVYLNRMPDGQGNTDNMNPVRIELRTDNTCFIVAGYNHDDWDDFLGEFTFDTLRNRISNLQKGTKGIDYYIFKIEEDPRYV